MVALLQVMKTIPGDFRIPIVAAFHLHRSDGGRFAEHLDLKTPLTVVEAREKSRLKPGHIHVAPADYHLLVERDGTMTLSTDPKVNWARPSIDVLFESAARAWGDQVIGVILSGANDDGARGMKLISEMGGVCLAQDPDTAQSRYMPQAAIEAAAIERVHEPERLGIELTELARKGRCHDA